MWFLSNIAGGNFKQAKSVIEPSLLSKIIHLLEHRESAVQKVILTYLGTHALCYLGGRVFDLQLVQSYFSTSPCFAQEQCHRSFLPNTLQHD